MKLIVGLGNPGKQFDRTPHNAGFELLDRAKIALEKLGLSVSAWTLLQKEQAEISEIYTAEGQKIAVLAKPQTYMNLSGKAVQLIINKYGLKNHNDILICYDELDIPLGKFKYSPVKNSRTHKGIDSIMSTVGKDLHSLRIGVDNRKIRQIPGEDYVLRHYTDDEMSTLKRACDEAFLQHLKEFLGLV